MAGYGMAHRTVRPGQRDLDRDREDDSRRVTARQPRCCPTARCSWRAGLRRHVTTPRRTRPSCTTRTRDLDRRSRTCRTARCDLAALLLPDGKVLRGWHPARHRRLGGLRPDHRNLDHTRCAARPRQSNGTAVGWHRAAWLLEGRPGCLYRRGAVRPAHRVVDDRLEHAPVPADGQSSFTLLRDGTVLVAGGSECNDEHG